MLFTLSLAPYPAATLCYAEHDRPPILSSIHLGSTILLLFNLFAYS